MEGPCLQLCTRAGERCQASSCLLLHVHAVKLAMNNMNMNMNMDMNMDTSNRNSGREREVRSCAVPRSFCQRNKKNKNNVPSE